MEKLQWTGQKGYNDAKWEDWKVKGKAAGYTKASGNLSVSRRDVTSRGIMLIG
jgi:hypothetical protein